jgi:hypothetical protein
MTEAVDLYWELKLAQATKIENLDAPQRCPYHVPPFSLTESKMADGRIEGRCTKCGGFIGYRYPSLPSPKETKAKGRNK